MGDASNPPTVLLISYHFHPSNAIGGRRPSALARFLVSKGVRVVVVSAFAGTQVDAGSELLPGVIAIPVKPSRRLLIDAAVLLKQSLFGRPAASTIPDRAPSALRRAQSHTRSLFFRCLYFIDDQKRWGLRAARAAHRAGRKFEARLVIASAPPNTLLLSGVLAARWLNVPYIADMRDPWADAVEYAHPERRMELRLLRLLEGWMTRSATAITSTGATVTKLLAARYPGTREKLHVVRNGFDEEIQRPPASTGGRLAMLFAGDLYFGRNPFPLLEALEHLLQQPGVDPSRISLTFMGSVEEYGGRSLREWLRDKRAAAVVRIRPNVPQPEVAEAVAGSTLLLNIAQQQHLSVPAKTYEHLASGREILLMCEHDCETAQVVADIGGINRVDPSVPGALDETLLDLYRRHVLEGRLTAPSREEAMRFSRSAANERFWSILSAVAELDKLPTRTALVPRADT